MYGHLLFAYSKAFPPLGRCCCGVLGAARLCCVCATQGVVANDNCFNLNRAAVSDALGEANQLVYADFE